MTPAAITVVGIGADGWTSLSEPGRAAILAAATIVGSRRQLAMLPPATGATQRAWPSPIDPLVDELVAGADGAVCVLASGDPMLHGIGATLARRCEPGRLVVHPHPSAFSLACARLGWPAADVALVSAVARDPDVVARLLQPGRRIVAYSTGAHGARDIARVVRERGFGTSPLTLLERLGAPGERVSASTADSFDAEADPLHAVAIDCVAAAGSRPLALVPGLPDDAYDSDGQLTKRHVRAITLAGLAPTPHALLWDVGAGSGSIGIEWLRAEATTTAIAVEPRDDRADRIQVNARALGVPDRVTIVRGRAPEALDGLTRPDAIFIGGGVRTPRLIDRCWHALRPGGRLVANAVTLEGEQVLVAARAARGGDLVRLEIAHAEPLGGLTGWRAQRPVVQWAATKAAR
jgi:precorrin-6Y C5,15-methyltransferase (decarboxylating)